MAQTPPERPAVKIGRLGESPAKEELNGLSQDHYLSYHNLQLPVKGQGNPTQIDSVVFSWHGIFVIEVKTYFGEIHGKLTAKKRTKYNKNTPKHCKTRLNKTVIIAQALGEITGLPEGVFHEIIYFSGTVSFIEQEVYNSRKLVFENLVETIHTRSKQVILPETLLPGRWTPSR